MIYYVNRGGGGDDDEEKDVISRAIRFTLPIFRKQKSG